jgi:hypothetical protein
MGAADAALCTAGCGQVAQGGAAPAAPCSGAAGRAARERPWGVGSRRAAEMVCRGLS